MPSTMLRRSRVLFCAIGFTLLASMPLASGLSAAAGEPQTGDEAITGITVTLSLDQVTSAGTSWIDDAGLHVRGLALIFTATGDVSGIATVETDLDVAGPCMGTTGTCDGEQVAFSSVELVGEAETWRGSLAIEQSADGRALAHGILIGRSGAADKVLVFDEVMEQTATTLSLSGSMVTLDGPIGGIQLSHSACITGETTADGGFIGARGLIEDSGPARITRQVIGSAAPLGVYGEVLDIGHKGRLRGLFVARINNQHAYGSFVIAGESGPYSGMLGYGRATMTLSEEPRCESGIQATSTWVGQARYLSDPATFLAPRVYFAAPSDGGQSTTPVALELVAEHVTIEPAGVARAGAGYLVVIIDAPCIGPGEPIPVDDQHIHLIGGETTTELNLFSGEHRLCLQLANGAGIAQPATDVIMVTVVSSDGGGGL